MAETIIKLDKQLKAHFDMNNRHARPSDADIREAGKPSAELKAKNEDIDLVREFVPNAVFDHVEVIGYDIQHLEQHQTLGTNERHWECSGDCIYNLYYK
ncbi:hypothetical protein [Paenibacillus sp. P32E]|uniref:hypothetical protein n=1 Tax=Paenibacillus sp. P32E TaxID=1349434 RepID=UPI000939E5AE|nr:hypothetical protein [Paenibacillus sp. P32E]OKP84334.1 hypothetical protein A3848_23895 [Paenibacillus sp. P32E]